MSERKFNVGDKVIIKNSSTKECDFGEVYMYHNINESIFYDVKLGNKKIVFGIAEKILKSND